MRRNSKETVHTLAPSMGRLPIVTSYALHINEVGKRPSRSRTEVRRRQAKESQNVLGAM